MALQTAGRLSWETRRTIEGERLKPAVLKNKIADLLSRGKFN
jgi:hypothetical protein